MKLKIYLILFVLVFVLKNVKSQTFNEYCQEQRIKIEYKQITNKRIEKIETRYEGKPFVKLYTYNLHGQVLYNYIDKSIITKEYAQLKKIGSTDNFMFSTKSFKREEIKFGILKDLKEEVFIECDQLYHLAGNELIVVKNGLYGLVDSELEFLIQPTYDKFIVHSAYPGYFKVSKNGKWGVVDKTGNVLVDIVYDNIHYKSFYIGVLKTKVPPIKLGTKIPSPPSAPPEQSGNSYDVYNSKFEKVLTVDYVTEIYTSYSMYQFKKRDENGSDYWIVYNTGGNKLYDGRLQRRASTNRKQQFHIIKPVNKEWGLIDYDGKEILPAIYPMLAPSSYNDFFITQDKTTSRVIDFDGNQLFETEEYNLRYDIGNGLIRADSDGKIGFLDYTGKVVIPFDYEEVISLNGVNVAKMNGKWGSIDAANNILLPFEFSLKPYLCDDYIILLVKDENSDAGKLNTEYYNFKGDKIECPIFE